MKQIRWILLLLVIVIGLPAHAVLKEDSITNTLSILRQELTTYHHDLEAQSKASYEQQELIFRELMTVVNRSNQNALMLYSQTPGNVFDLSYACHEATQQYADFQKNIMPFKLFLSQNDTEIARYDSLISNLSDMYTATLNNKAMIDRNVCLTLSVNIRRNLKYRSDQLAEYIRIYRSTEVHLKNLNDYADKRYQEIQNNIFNNNGSNYFDILSKIKSEVRQTSNVVENKYRPLRNVNSQWDSRIIIMMLSMMLFLAVISIALNIVILRYLVPRRFRTDAFVAKRSFIILAASVVTLAILLVIMRTVFKTQNFIIMASDLVIGFTWLVGVILISLLLRMEGKQMKSAFLAYTPLIIIGFIVISFRIIMIPNRLNALILPPILLVCLFFQAYILKRHRHRLPKTDVFYASITLGVFVGAVIASWSGYILLCVQLLIWWIMQLTCILTITCIGSYLNTYAEHKKLNNKPITSTWSYHLINSVFLPILGVLSVILSIYWAADVFSLSDNIMAIFKQNFIHTDNFSTSIYSISLVIILYFVFRYLNKTIKALVKQHFERRDITSAGSRNVMAKNVIQVIIWGLWFIISLNIFHINSTWLGIASVGFSTGVGFAMKDILENIYYGISLMAGRVKVGDWIEIDGIRGRISSITYTSTVIDATDGSIIAFQNNQLFTKNYKNMTKNHGYELDALEVGVAYGTDIPYVKKLLTDALMQLDCVNKERGANILMKSFGDSSIILKILVWVPVLTHAFDDGKILECVYKTLNDNRISMPFPQRDVHIIKTDADTELRA